MTGGREGAGRGGRRRGGKEGGGRLGGGQGAGRGGLCLYNEQAGISAKLLKSTTSTTKMLMNAINNNVHSK